MWIFQIWYRRVYAAHQSQLISGVQAHTAYSTLSARASSTLSVSLNWNANIQCPHVRTLCPSVVSVRTSCAICWFRGPESIAQHICECKKNVVSPEWMRVCWLPARIPPGTLKPILRFTFSEEDVRICCRLDNSTKQRQFHTNACRCLEGSRHCHLCQLPAAFKQNQCRGEVLTIYTYTYS